MWLDRKGSTVVDVAGCKRLLAVAADLELIGRVGIATDQAPVIIPVNFTVRDGQIGIRVGRGFLLSAAADQLVAFEVDHVDSDAGWAWSVLVRGLATMSEHLTEGALDSGAQPLVPVPGDQGLTIRPDVLTGRRFQIRAQTSLAVSPVKSALAQSKPVHQLRVTAGRHPGHPSG
jgi:hypothetical protein